MSGHLLNSCDDAYIPLPGARQQSGFLTERIAGRGAKPGVASARVRARAKWRQAILP